MNKALMFHMQISIKNSIRQTIKRPLKSLGVLAAIAYFAFLPFMMKNMIEQFGMNNPYGFVLLNSVFTLYLSMPTTLTYFKRNGVNFTKPDVNFMFAAPIDPKQVLFYGLMKQVYLKVIVQFIAIIAAIFIFNISAGLALFYGFVSFVISSLSEYSLAIILYGSEKLSDKHKQIIKRLVFIMIIIVSLLIVFELWKSEFDAPVIFSLANHPLILLTPIFGWKLGLMNLMFMGATPINVLSSVLYVLSAIIFTILAYRMKCKGDYYEDGIKFTEERAKLLEKKGNISLSEAFGKKKKVHDIKTQLKGFGAQTIFFKQVLEYQRVRPYFLSISDIVMLVLSIGGGLIFKSKPMDSGLFFVSISALALYLVVFFQADKRWKEEFKHYYMYLIPQSNLKKLWYSTLLELLHICVQAILLTMPAAILLRVSILECLLAMIVQIALKSLMLYKSILFEGYVEGKLGVNATQLLSMVLSIVILIIPAILIILGMFIPYIISVLGILLYSILLNSLVIFLCTKIFTNIESLNKA